VDERYVAVDVTGNGLVLFSACSHAGICNVVSDAMERFHRPIYAVCPSGEDVIDSTTSSSDQG
jgi:7,8-dihydropterin-6-yl-methyl-4-(beta-D-ribofuranosyl)aminobenzene 5'-phosphate synthase